MDCEFPDPDDEFDLIHEEDYEVLKDFEGTNVKNTSTAVDQNLHNNCVQPSVPVQTTQSNCHSSAAVTQSSQNGFVHSINNSNKKRTFEELFGDISDLIESNDLSDLQEPKEKRPCWNQPDKIIEVILAAKKNLHEKNNHASVSTASSFVNEQKNSISLRIPPWNFVPVTRYVDGQRLYVRVRDTSQYTVTKNRSLSGLLTTSYSQLKAEAEEIMIRRTKCASLLPPESIVDDASVEDELWVNKYRPRTYMELLSDDSVNRAFLHWLKLWDKIVFNREPIKHRKLKQTPQFGTKKFINNKDTTEIDKKGFPVHRIALLSGPPGLGKTTLAHVAAKHAGYNVVEINASDDRGPDAFRQALLSSTQMRSVIGANPKPNCLILDEIDGAPAASIDLLLKFIYGKLTSKSKKSKEKPDKESAGCRRPIVCICNEAYTSSLRALRLIALIIPVPSITPSRLVDRLMIIAQKEEITADPRALLQLAERSGSDIRACLGALQYMGQAKVGENLTLGLKDCRKGLFDSWKEIFQIPMNKTGSVPLQERTRNILKVVQSGETDRLAQGIFHNYPAISNNKVNVVSNSLNWFEFFDEITTHVATYQAWVLMPYTNYAFVEWHLNFATIQTPKLSYPTVMREIRQRLTRNTAILTTSQRASGRDILTLTLDIAPLLPELLTPRLRSVSSHLYSAKEKSDLAHLVNIMLDLGLAFVQDINSEGSYEYHLEPNLFEIGIFPECKVRRSLSYSVKQILVLELEAERLRRADAANVALKKSIQDEGNDDREKLKKSNTSKESETKVKAPSTSFTTPNNQRSAKSITDQFSPETEYRDFFGRPISRGYGQRSSKSTSPNSESSLRDRETLTRNCVWYKYKEGFSNAVRRKVTMKDLL